MHPRVIYVSVSGFGNTIESPYDTWAAYAVVAEAMSGIYDRNRPEDQAPVVGPVGALGDISSALFAVIGVLSALRHRDRTGEGQYVDIAMLGHGPHLVALAVLVGEQQSIDFARVDRLQIAFGLEEALAQLLAGTGITYRKCAARGWRALAMDRQVDWG